MSTPDRSTGFWTTLRAPRTPLARIQLMAWLAAAPVVAALVVAIGALLAGDAPVLYGALMALAATGLLALPTLALLVWVMRADVARCLAEATRTVDALAAGELGVVIRDSADDAVAGLNGALRRLAHQLRDNAETAQALADGAYRRAARPMAAHDPIGIALARLTTRVTDLAATSQRVARGEPGLGVTPQSDEDTFGRAYAAMLEHVAATLMDVESTRVAMLTVIDAMRGDAAALASSAHIDADRLRRTEEQLATVALQARTHGTRGAVLAERATESEALLASGAAALQSSINGVCGVLRSAETVQHLAREAGLLAVRGATTTAEASEDEAVRHAGAARALATDAAAAASTITRMMISGTEHAYEAGVAFDRVAIAVRDGTALVHELGIASRGQAAALQEIDETVLQVSRTTSNSAETARQLVHRLDSLASQTRRLELTGRRVPRRRMAPMINVTTSASGAVVTSTTATSAMTA